jgi:hypothetical protein
MAIIDTAGISATGPLRTIGLGAWTGRTVTPVKKSRAPHGPADSLLKFVLPAVAASSQSAPIAHSVHKPASKTIDELSDEKCAWCAKPFTTTRTDKKYCCVECQQNAWAQKISQDAAAKRATLRCSWCGAPIIGATRKDAKYCSLKCRGEAQYERRNGWRAELRVRTICVGCGVNSPDAGDRRRKYCKECRRKRHRENNRRSEQKARAKQKAESDKVSA